MIPALNPDEYLIHFTMVSMETCEQYPLPPPEFCQVEYHIVLTMRSRSSAVFGTFFD